MVLGGMVALIASILLYLVVHQRWQLIFPATLAGISHAVLFPAIVAGGSATFPHRYRGLATSLMLGSFDVGTLIGAPIVGGLLRGSELLSWDPFPSTFVIVACLLAATTVYFFAHSRTHRDVT
jgi:MFS family permease